MTTCQVCQHQNPAGADYCEDCGASLTASTGTGTGTSAPAAPPATSAPVQVATPPATSAAPAASTASAPPASAPTPGTPAPAPEGAPPSATTPTANTASTAPATATPTSASAGTGGTGTSGQPRLAIRRYGALTGEEIPLLGERLVVGRFDPETGPVDVDLSSIPENQHISRQHGELYREADGNWFVRDLGSTNGVFVKGGADTSFGQRITAPRQLANGDEVAFGNARFVFRTE